MRPTDWTILQTPIFIHFYIFYARRIWIVWILVQFETGKTPNRTFPPTIPETSFFRYTRKYPRSSNRPKLKGDRPHSSRVGPLEGRTIEKLHGGYKTPPIVVPRGHKGAAWSWQSIRAPFRPYLTRISFTNHLAPIPRGKRTVPRVVR